MQFLKTTGQVLLLCGISVIGNSLSELSGMDIPGNLVGMAILFGLLEYKVIALDWVEAGANFLIAELLLFFIPSAIGIMQYENIFASKIGALLFVLVFSIIAVLLFVVFSTELVSRYRGRREKAC
ncbi:CidA/LrgA family protein [Anaerospora sp.]|uniref:CidA/LrgA family protein n=1 Tax=Anaerospora sp. TaxID=1960278 RepID=UPI002896DBA7|nr:CidA/LrgA family protein [Anaerospora sp.]